MSVKQAKNMKDLLRTFTLENCELLNNIFWVIILIKTFKLVAFLLFSPSVCRKKMCKIRVIKNTYLFTSQKHTHFYFGREKSVFFIFEKTSWQSWVFKTNFYELKFSEFCYWLENSNFWWRKLRWNCKWLNRV